MNKQDISSLLSDPNIPSHLSSSVGIQLRWTVDGGINPTRAWLPNDQLRETRGRRGPYACRHCGERGHSKKFCPALASPDVKKQRREDHEEDDDNVEDDA
jgi:hypothetical protein